MRLVPQFILAKYNQQKHSGKLQGSILFTDISGFTALTAGLMQQGKEGAEVLSKVLEQVFSPLVSQVYAHQGFVSGFAGDAFSALFHGPGCRKRAVAAALAIQARAKAFETLPAGCAISVKVGLAHGLVRWNIAGAIRPYLYYFRGPAVARAARAEHQASPGQVVVHQDLLRGTPAWDSKALTGPYYRILPTGDNHIMDTAGPAEQGSAAGRENFVDARVLSGSVPGEFRTVAAVFVSFSGLRRLKPFIADLQQAVRDFHGYLNRVCFGDKGPHALLLFGAPQALEKPLQHAVKAVHKLREKYPAIASGATLGYVYAGFVGSKVRAEYTVLGASVNMAADLMTRAGAGEILVPDDTLRFLKPYQLESLGRLDLKGSPGGCMVSRVLAKKPRELQPRAYCVGRSRDVDACSLALQTWLQQGTGGIVYVYGEAGIGKSTMARHICGVLAQSMTLQVVWLQVDPILRKLYNPVASFLDRYFFLPQGPKGRSQAFNTAFERLIRQLRACGPAVDDSLVQDLARMRSFIAAVAGLYQDGSPYFKVRAKDRPQLVQTALELLFTCLCRVHPLIIVVDDLLWIDEATKSLLERLANRGEKLPLSLIVTSRPTDTGRQPGLQEGEADRTHVLALQGLAAADTRDLLDALLGAPAAKPLCDYIFQRAEGNPFYTEQLCLYMKEAGLLAQTTKGIQLTQPTSKLPMGMHALLTSRIDRLSRELKDLVQISSVLGMEFEQEVVTQVVMGFYLGEDPRFGTYAQHMTALLAQGGEEQIWNLVKEMRYMFRHLLLKEAAYEMQLKSRLKAIHAVAAQTLVTLYTGRDIPLADVAFHWQQAQRPGIAIGYLRRAARQAYQQPAYREALRFHKTALKLCKSRFGSSHAIFAKALQDAGESQFHSADYQAALVNLRHALALRARQWPSRHRGLAVLHNFIGRIHCIRYELDQAMASHQQALDILRQRDRASTLERANTYTHMVSVLQKRGAFSKALELTDKIQSQHVAAGSGERAFMDYYHRRANIYDDLAEYDKALQEYTHALDISKRYLGEDHLETLAFYHNMGITLWRQGKYPEALRLQKQYLDKRLSLLGERHPVVALVYNNIGNCYYRMQQYALAEQAYGNGLRIHKDVLGENNPETCRSYVNLSNVYCAYGRYDRAMALCRKALAILIPALGKQHQLVSVAMNILACAAYEQGDYDQALEYFHESLAIRRALYGEMNDRVALEWMNIGKVYYSMKMYENALEVFVKAIDIGNSVFGKDSPVFAEWLLRTSRCHLTLGNKRQASACLSRARDMYQAAGDRHGVEEVQQLLQNL